MNRTNNEDSRIMPDYRRWVRAGGTYSFAIVTFITVPQNADMRVGTFELSSLGQGVSLQA